MPKVFVFWLILGGFFLAFAEGLAFLSYYLMDDLYDHREEVLARLSPEGLAGFAAKAGDPVTGWARRGPMQSVETDCLGRDVAFAWDETGARLYDHYDRDAVKIVFVGDSYMHGSEAGPGDAIPALVAGRLGLSAANHGVGGFGPVQAFLTLREKIDLYPDADTAVLGIMYENAHRMLNSYRSVLYDGSLEYRLKPYMSDGRIVPHPGAEVLRDFDTFEAVAASAFDSDFWARPRHEFPYTVSMVRGLGSNYFLLREVQRKSRSIGVSDYRLTYGSEVVTSNLVSLIGAFTDFVKAKQMQPVVFFMPHRKHDTTSVATFIADNRDSFDPALTIVDAGQADMDWERYSLTNGDKVCHPSAYGYRRLAEHLAAALETAGLLASK